jgi:hypothetical protein
VEPLEGGWAVEARRADLVAKRDGVPTGQLPCANSHPHGLPFGLRLIVS